MMRKGVARVLLAVLAGVYGATALAAQQADVRARLTARGLPASLAGDVAVVAAQASASGLPIEPLIDKAAEGWAKRVPAPRILSAVRDLSARLAVARDALAGAGTAGSNPRVVGSAADALGRGITREDVVEIVSAAPAAEAAAAGLAVAAALAAQGLDRSQSVRIVVETMRGGHPVADVLDLPAAARAMQGQGVPPADVGRRLLDGVGRGGGAGRGPVEPGARPPIVPPGLGGQVPGQSKRP